MRFDLLFGVGDGVGEAFLRFAEAVGDGVGVGVFVECFRCLCDGVGLGSGSRTFLIFEPNDSLAEGAASTAPNKITRIRSHFIIRRCSVRYSAENRVQYFGRMPSGQRILQPVKRSAGSPQRFRLGGYDAHRLHRQDVCATTARALAGLLCSSEFRLRNFREESFR